MTTAPAPNHRASLLAGLRTGGVRSSSANLPHTAAPGATFSLPRFPSQQYPPHFPEEDEDQLSDMPAPNPFVNHSQGRPVPMTAAVDGPSNRFAQQQAQGQRGMNPNSIPFSPAYPPNIISQSAQAQAQAQNQAFQMQMMQLELMRIQAIQAQQYQAELLAQAQRQQQQKQQQMLNQNRRASAGFVPPATAGPTATSFDLRSAALSAQLRRNAPDQSRQHLGVPGDDQVPMTAALGGKFGSRTASLSVPNSHKYGVENLDDLPPPTPSHTTVISGGTSLGNPASNNIAISTPSKSDAATSWRRGGNNNSVLSGNNRTVSSPSVKITPPPGERVSPPPAPASGFAKRPQPLRFSATISQHVPDVAIEVSSDSVDDAASSASGGSNSAPTTPRSTSSQDAPLSPREEATKKLYEGLGLGRPNVSADVAVQPQSAAPSHRMVSQPMRQPRGPPSGADELGPKNFARMMRRGAVGGLGVLANARERREAVEAY
ncbi:hypothetical protein AX16_000115 [Volvariella volvacea WC 439]|nr:hypothetical protein AX16_000115 [Volvariella volvacea WC 439]